MNKQNEECNICNKWAGSCECATGPHITGQFDLNMSQESAIAFGGMVEVAKNTYCEKELEKMYCYDEQGNCLGVISCAPKGGEEHAWGDNFYICTGEWTKDKGCENGLIFKKVN